MKYVEPAPNAKLKCRWYQFSLKTLLVVMTLVGIVLGRVAYLRHG